MKTLADAKFSVRWEYQCSHCRTFTVQYFDLKADDGVVHVHNKFLAVRHLKQGNAQGLLDCFKSTSRSDWKIKLVAFGRDGASVNIGGGGG